MRTAGFSIIELLIATTATVAITAAVLSVLGPFQAGFAAQTEAVDVQQRLRTATNSLIADLAVAGVGPDRGAQSGPLLQSFAPVLPFRRNTNADDGPGSYFGDRITLLSVPAAAPHASVAIGGPALDSDVIGVDPLPQCAPGDALCLFTVGTDVAVFDGNGAVDLFSITGLAPDASVPALRHAGRSLAFTAYRQSTAVVAGMSTVSYAFNRRASQLVVSHGLGGIDAPVVDNVVAVAFTYRGDALPPQLGTYGPQPPPIAAENPNTAWPPGENCAFAVVDGAQVPRLPALGDGSVLIPLAAAQLTDGPWCPDAASANRWDADLLRIRAVTVTVRVQAAIAALRGPAGSLFVNAGTGTNPQRWVPDHEITFQISPRSLNLGSTR